MQNYTAAAEVTINAPAAKVWEALTTPDLVKEYMFGSTVRSDWEEGSPIIYAGEWNGKPYEDKGEILEIRPQEILRMNYFSPRGGQADVPENYQIITWELAENNGQTRVVVTQENSKSQSDADHSTENWRMVLVNLKRVAEDNAA